MKRTSASKWALDTPCLVLDLDVLEGNLEKMQAAVSRVGKQLRPHAKTHKCSALARRQIAAGAIGVCAAKVSEAEMLVKAGLRGILITGPVATPGKIGRLVELVAAAPSVMAVVDHRAGVQLLDEALRAKGLTMGVLLDLDVGLHRTGVNPADARELAGQILACKTLRLLGVQAYAGQVQHIPAQADRATASRQCLREAIAVFRELRERVDTCRIFSASGTGTFSADLALPELTEVQPGSYACMDTEYLKIEPTGAGANFEPALRLLTTVVSANQPGFVTVDAGLKALYRDGGLPRVLGAEQAGLEYAWFGDEYGKIVCPANAPPPPLGTVLELVPSHCDPTINLFDRFYLTRGEKVVDAWPIDLRGCGQ